MNTVDACLRFAGDRFDTSIRGDTDMKRFLVLATVFAALAVSGPALAEGDAAAGETVFKKKCKSCHRVGEGAKSGIGPVLNGILGANAGRDAKFKYSKVMKAKIEEGLVWSPDALDAFLEKPSKYLPKTKMTFPGLKKDADRDNVIAYLKGFGD